jgi:triosephosphate isomerase
VYLPEVIAALHDTDIGVGAQNVSEQQQGAYTGEVSADMLRDIGCRYAIVGHSERRTLYGENDEQVAAKFMAAQAEGLVPILCVGETLAQREQGETLTVINSQLDAVIQAAGIKAVCSAVIAYEPVWAIGTGKTATAEQAQEVHQAIRQQLGANGEGTRVLYGGSVKAANAAELFAQPDIDGALVGGASLNSAEFGEICKLA